MILQATREKVTKTKIMYKAYLSYSQVKEYLTYLVENDLVMLDKSDQMYSITQKGHEFLTKYDEMSELVSQEKEKLTTIS